MCLLGSVGLLLPQLSGCGTAFPVYKTEVSNKKLQIPLVLFDKSATQIVRPKGWMYDIAAQKLDNQQYHALLLQCTHQDNQLSISNNGYQCSLHGSRFDVNGQVSKGPASLPLQQYKTYIQKDQLIIEI